MNFNMLLKHHIIKFLFRVFYLHAHIRLIYLILKVILILSIWLYLLIFVASEISPCSDLDFVFVKWGHPFWSHKNLV